MVGTIQERLHLHPPGLQPGHLGAGFFPSTRLRNSSSMAKSTDLTSAQGTSRTITPTPPGGAYSMRSRVGVVSRMRQGTLAPVKSVITSAAPVRQRVVHRGPASIPRRRPQGGKEGGSWACSSGGGWGCLRRRVPPSGVTRVQALHGCALLGRSLQILPQGELPIHFQGLGRL